MTDGDELEDDLSQVAPQSAGSGIVAGGGWTTETVLVERRELRPRADAWRLVVLLLLPFTIASMAVASVGMLIGEITTG